MTLFSGFSLIKWVAGFAFWRGEKLGKLLFYAVLAVVAFGIYHKIFFQPRTYTNIKFVKPATVNYSTPAVCTPAEKEQEALFLGIKLWRLKLGVRVR
jgi:hypothetical protein